MTHSLSLLHFITMRIRRQDRKQKKNTTLSNCFPANKHELWITVFICFIRLDGMLTLIAMPEMLPTLCDESSKIQKWKVSTTIQMLLHGVKIQNIQNQTRSYCRNSTFYFKVTYVIIDMPVEASDDINCTSKLSFVQNKLAPSFRKWLHHLCLRCKIV
jgi:hypothetical protein